MRIRIITAAAVCAALVVFCCVTACAVSNLEVNCQDEGVTISSKEKVSTMAMGSFSVDEGQHIDIEYDIASGSMELSISNAYLGTTVFSEHLESSGEFSASAPQGEYAVTIDTTDMVGSVEITAVS